MKTLKPVYLKQSNNNGKIALIIFFLVVAFAILFATVVNAQTTENVAYINKAGINASAVPANSSAIIKWNAAADSKYTFFLIERSKDKVHYEFVSVVKNTGSINSTNFYTGTDYNPMDGAAYYRVTETNFKGNQVHLFEVKFSPVQTLSQN